MNRAKSPLCQVSYKAGVLFSAEGGSISSLVAAEEKI